MSVPQRADEEAVSAAGAPDAAHRAEARRRAYSLPPAFPQPEGGTPAGNSASRVQAAVMAVSAALTGGSLLHTQPPSLHQTWTRHVESARHFNAWLVRWPRYGWGAVHVVLKAVLHALEWVTESPPRLLVAAAIIAACWLLRG